MSMETTKTASHGVILTPNAAAKVKNLLAQEDRDDYRLRIAVDSGGCSGLKYQLFFDERVEEGDAIVEFDGVGLIVDRKSVPYLEGAAIDFHDSIEKQGFDIDNPNATNSCACGESFS
jgi:iron-sulfur cluster assembly accessory protein